MLAASVWEAEGGEEGVRHPFQYVACHLILLFSVGLLTSILRHSRHL